MDFSFKGLGIEGLDCSLAEGLLATVAGPRNASGFIPVLKGVGVSLRKLSDSTEIDGLVSLRERVDRVRMLLAESEALGPSIRAMPDIYTVSPPYRLAIKIVGHAAMQRSDAHNENLLIVLGAIFLWHLLALKPLPKVRAEQLLAVLAGPSYRSRNRHHWCELANALSPNADRIVSAVASISYEPAKDLGCWIASIMRDVKSCKVPQQAESHRLKAEASSSERVGPKALLSESQQRQFCDSEEAIDGSLVRWSYQRAINASLSGVAGQGHCTYPSCARLIPSIASL